MDQIPRQEPNFIQRFFRRQTFLALFVLTVVAGSLSGLVIAKQIELTDEAQQVLHLQDYKPDVVTRVFADDTKTIIGEFSLERRIPLQGDEIPPRMRQAFLAIEDVRFYQHVGIDPVRLMGAALRNLTSPGRRPEGASTITQQLARNLFLSAEQTWTRKIREALISLAIERYYTKDQILTMYCNQIFLGGGAYGVQAAAQYYFDKSVSELSLSQIAMLAALPKAPSNYSPVLRPREALQRRNLVLESMAEAGFITRAEAAAAKDEPLGLSKGPKVTNNDLPYAYFVEEVRKELEHGPVAQRYNIHHDGLNVYTTLDASAQRQAERAVRKGLHAYDRRHRRWRGNLYNVIESDGVKELKNYQHPDWINQPEADDFIRGLIVNVTPAGAEVRIGDYKAMVTEKETGWTQKAPVALFKRGDLAVFQIKQVNEKEKTVTVSLEQVPAVQGALIAVDVKTGEVKAMVGGYDFNTNKFNNATQANRQTGSAFKPFIYAAAIENGFSPDDIVNDAPFARGDWAPHNYDNSFKGPIPLRLAMAQSRNIPAVRLLDEVGIQRGVKMVQRFGLPNPMAPYLPSALGATEEPLIAMVSAYSVFPNQGLRVEPHYIKRVTDRYGQAIYEAKPNTEKVLSPYVASQMVNLMQGVVQFGTAASIRGYKELASWPIAGKTGTVNDFTDAWFIGYTAELSVGAWIGYAGEKRSLGNKETGGVAALPMWVDFMRPLLRERKPVEFPKTPPPDEEVLTAQSKHRRTNAERLAKEAADMSIEQLSEDAKRAMKEAAAGGAGDTEAPGASPPQINDRVVLEPRPGDDMRPVAPPVERPRPIERKSDSEANKDKKEEKKPGFFRRIFGGGKKDKEKKPDN